MRSGRRWLELRARGPSDQEEEDDLLAEGLLALGGRAVEERDGWYVTHLEEPPDPGAFLEGARSVLEAMTGRVGVRLEHRLRAHEDWAERWKRGLATRRISPRLVVTPSWIPCTPEPGEEVVILDPGVAFGTAEHGTTRGCLRLLDRVVDGGERLLDVGAGSGILSIAAALLGAAEVVAVEGDEMACEALEENVERNRVADRVRVVSRWVDHASLPGLAPVDGVVANIEWGRLRPLVPALRTAVAPGGWVVLSGILAGELPEARSDAEGLGLRVREVDADGAWRSLLLSVPAG
jgi:ribosomal protein L11 methyltransferase